MRRASSVPPAMPIGLPSNRTAASHQQPLHTTKPKPAFATLTLAHGHMATRAALNAPHRDECLHVIRTTLVQNLHPLPLVSVLQLSPAGKPTRLKPSYTAFVHYSMLKISESVPLCSMLFRTPGPTVACTVPPMAGLPGALHACWSPHAPRGYMPKLP